MIEHVNLIKGMKKKEGRIEFDHEWIVHNVRRSPDLVVGTLEDEMENKKENFPYIQGANLKIQSS